jgi:AraC-like DNA-binding protein
LGKPAQLWIAAAEPPLMSCSITSAPTMEHLQQEGPAASIQAVALACGYRQTSQFSTDFKRRFGLSPSQVKRASLG